jgi:hypothetical protein
MIKSINQFQLIDSTYDLHEARDVVLSLINYKIKFINLTIFNREERYGDDCIQLKNRLRELNVLKSKLTDYFLDLNGEDLSVIIDCPVNIRVEIKGKDQVGKIEKKL